MIKTVKILETSRLTGEVVNEGIDVYLVTEKSNDGTARHRALYAHTDYESGVYRLFFCISDVMAYVCTMAEAKRFDSESAMMKYIKDTPFDNLPENHNFKARD